MLDIHQPLKTGERSSYTFHRDLLRYIYFNFLFRTTREHDCMLNAPTLTPLPKTMTPHVQPLVRASPLPSTQSPEGLGEERTQERMVNRWVSDGGNVKVNVMERAI